MKEVIDFQKVNNLLSCLSRIAQEIMVPHFMTFYIWTAVKEALISEFGGAHTLSNQKHALMLMKICSGELATSYAERFYQEAQALFTCGRLNLNESLKAGVFLVKAHPQLHLYLKRIF